MTICTVCSCDFEDGSCECNRCEHHENVTLWVFVKDWMGDPNVINGTTDCSFWRCKACDEEVEIMPEGWEDPIELDADYLRDKRIDDELTGDL